MYRKILIATDGSESANKAVRHGSALAKATGAALLVVNVTHLWSALDIANAAEAGVADPIGEYEAIAARSAKGVLNSADAIVKAAGATCEKLHVQDSTPAVGILSSAKSRGCDLIVMGTHGRRGLGRLLLGSQAAEVLASSAVPVLVVR